MARYQNGLRVPTNLFECAAWHYAIRIRCSACLNVATFNAHGLWWHFERRGLDDTLNSVPKHFWCRACASRLNRRVRPTGIEVVEETEDAICLPFPDERVWKRAINRFRS